MRRPSARRRWLISGVVVVLLAAIAVHVSRSGGGDLAGLRRLSATVLLVTIVVQFLSQLFFNAAMLLPLRPHVERLGYWEFFIVRTGGMFAGSVVPVAGNIGVRLAYLRRRGLAYSKFAWATLLSNVLALVAAGALAVLATGALWLARGTVPGRVWALSAGVLIISITALIGFQLLPRLAGHRWVQNIRGASAMSGLKASRRTMAAVFAHSLARHGLNFVTFGLLYRALSGVPADFLTGGLVYALTTPVRIVNVTPANLGVNEWVVALVGKALNFDVTTGLLVALAFRVIALLGQGIGVLVGGVWVALWSKP